MAVVWWNQEISSLLFQPEQPYLLKGKANKMQLRPKGREENLQQEFLKLEVLKPLAECTYLGLGAAEQDLLSKKAAVLQRQHHTPCTLGWRYWFGSQQLHKLITRASAGAYEPHLFLQLTGQETPAGTLLTPAFSPSWGLGCPELTLLLPSQSTNAVTCWYYL